MAAGIGSAAAAGGGEAGADGVAEAPTTGSAVTSASGAVDAGAATRKIVWQREQRIRAPAGPTLSGASRNRVWHWGQRATTDCLSFLVRSLR